MSAPDAASFDAEITQVFRRLGFGEIDQLAFDLRAYGHGLSREMIACVILDRPYVLLCAMAGVSDPSYEGRQIGLGDVAGEKCWFGREEEKFACDDLFFIR
jgi:hypothetical protein